MEYNLLMEKWRVVSSLMTEQTAQVSKMQRWFWGHGFAHNPKNKTEDEWIDGKAGPEYRQTIRNFQTRAKELEFYDREIDADIGSGTLKAMKAFDKYDKSRNQGPELPQSATKPRINNKPKEMPRRGSDDVTGVPDSSFPIVNGRNFIEPVPGLLRIDASFGQNRSSKVKKKKHKAIDQNIPPGRDCVAITDCVVTSVTSNRSFDWCTKSLQRLLKTRVFEPRDPSDFEAAHDKGAWRAIPDIRTLRKKIKSGRVDFSRLGSLSWPEFKKWCKRNLYYNAAASIMRHYKEVKKPKQLLWFPSGGIEVVVQAPADQNGKVYKMVYSHLDSAVVSKGQKLSIGDKIGTTGDTAIFDSRAHLHFQMAEIPSRKRVDPQKVIPNLAHGLAGTYEDNPNLVA